MVEIGLGCCFRVVLVLTIVGLLCCAASASEYNGKYCSGRGDLEYLRLIDRSFGCFHPEADIPNISMVYVPEWDSFVLGPCWPMWWIQNSYGPTFCCLPFLQQPWVDVLQRSQDFWFKHQGDGKSKDSFDPVRPPGVPELIAPDGCLVDAASPTASYHKQGDGAWWDHDWFFEATAAGVVMQAELLLVGHDISAVRNYISNLERACDFIETARDPRNNLFLVGPACNLLAPSYGGIRQPDGTFGKGYLTGVSITYIAALDRMIELEKLIGTKSKQELYEARRKITLDSLPQLLAPEGYFVKSMEIDGTKHGVYGQEKFGYFEVSPNVDAICHRVIDDSLSEKIYAKIASIPELRPNAFIITNYPGLDDTYWSYGTADTPDGIYKFGHWVNGGAWLNLDARAIMAYYRLGKYEDVRRSARAFMKFADQYQIDSPFTDCGRQLWFKNNLTNICHDDFGVPAAVIRGLFEYNYSADSLTLRPHVPPTITEYSQHEPIRFGEKRIMISIKNGGQRIQSLKVNGKPLTVSAQDYAVLSYDFLPKIARVEIVTAGGWPEKPICMPYVFVGEDAKRSLDSVRLPDDLAKPYAVLTQMKQLLKDKPGLDYEKAFVSEAISAFDAYRIRAQRYHDGAYPGIGTRKHGAILKLYKNAALGMYKALDKRVRDRAASGDSESKIVAGLLDEARRDAEGPKELR